MREEVTEDSIDRWLRDFQISLGDFSGFGEKEMNELWAALHDDVPLGYEASMRLADWLRVATLETGHKRQRIDQLETLLTDAFWLAHGLWCKVSLKNLTMDEARRLDVLRDALGVEVQPHKGGGVAHAPQRTCAYKPMWDTSDPLAEDYLGMWHTGCGGALTWNLDNDGCGEPPAFCPYCGGVVRRLDA